MAAERQPDQPTPEELLLADIDADAFTADGLAPEPPPPPEVARQYVERFQKEFGIELPRPSPPLVTPASRSRFSQALHLPPIATLAAADIVKTSVRWEAGEVRLLQSPMRADLAVEVLTDEPRREEFAKGVFFVSVNPPGQPVAVLPEGSPVFCRLFADDLAAGADAALEWVPRGELTREHAKILERSSRNLRDPASLEEYDALLSGLGEG